MVFYQKKDFQSAQGQKQNGTPTLSLACNAAHWLAVNTGPPRCCSLACLAHRVAMILLLCTGQDRRNTESSLSSTAVNTWCEMLVKKKKMLGAPLICQIYLLLTYFCVWMISYWNQLNYHLRGIKHMAFIITFLDISEQWNFYLALCLSKTWRVGLPDYIQFKERTEVRTTMINQAGVNNLICFFIFIFKADMFRLMPSSTPFKIVAKRKTMWLFMMADTGEHWRGLQSRHRVGGIYCLTSMIKLPVCALWNCLSESTGRYIDPHSLHTPRSDGVGSMLGLQAVTVILLHWDNMADYLQRSQV